MKPILAVSAVAIGVFLGGCSKDQPIQAAPAAPPPGGLALPGAPPPPMMAQPPGASGVGQRIEATKQALEKDPKNASLWVQLGNDYFDTHQAQLSVDAYAKALELRPDDPDVLTDQGVMYRELRKYDRALANFEKAGKLKPGHLQSIFNMGVVYGFDLHDVPKAIEAFNKVIAIDPNSPQAVQARASIRDLQQQPPPAR